MIAATSIEQIHLLDYNEIFKTSTLTSTFDCN